MSSLQGIGISQARQIVLLVSTYSARHYYALIQYTQLFLYHILLEERGAHRTCPYLHQKCHVLHNLKGKTQLVWAEE